MTCRTCRRCLDQPDDAGLAAALVMVDLMSPALDRAIDFLQQLRAKVMIIDFDHMAQSLVETPVR